MNLCRKTEIFLKQNLEPPIIYCFRRLSSILYFLYLRECQESDSKIPIITTGRAGGLHRPPWGLFPAEPIGSSNLLSTA